MGRAQSVEARAMLRLFENSEKILGAMSAAEKQDPEKVSRNFAPALPKLIHLPQDSFESTSRVRACNLLVCDMIRETRGTSAKGISAGK